MKKAFTLIELISVIIIIGVVALISTPIATNIIDKSKEKAYKNIVENIEQSAYNYSIANDLGYKQSYESIELETLQVKGYMENDTIIDPRNSTQMEGCVFYRWLLESKQYEFIYDDDCTVDDILPEIKINVLNENKFWLQENLRFQIDSKYDSYKYCVGSNECDIDKNYTGTTTIAKDGENMYICAVGYFGDQAGKSTCVGPYNVDTTAPNISVAVNNIRTDRATITATCTDLVSNISKYEFSKDNGVTWVSNGTTSNYTFTGLTQGTSYTFRIRCTNGSGISKEIESEEIILSKMTNPTIAYENTPETAVNGYLKKQILKVTYDNANIQNPTYYVKTTREGTSNITVTESCGTGTNPSNCSPIASTTSLAANTWYKVSGNVNVTYDTYATSEGTLYAVTYDGTNFSGAATKTISKITKDVTYIVKHYQMNTDMTNYTLYETETLTATANYTATPSVKTYTGFNAPSTQTVTVAADGSTVVEYKYARKQVVVTFYRNTSSGDTTTATQTFTYGVTGQKFTSKGWTKSGSTQVGWTTTASGVYKWSVTSGVSDGWINSNSPSIKLYAVWVVNPTITLTNTPTTAVNGYLTKQVATVKYPTANLTTPNYYIKTTRAGTSNIAVTSSCGTSTNPGTCSTITSTKTLAANTWYKVSGNLTVTYNTTATSTGTIYAYAYDGTAKRTTASKNISKIDPTAPSVPTITYNGGANTCTWKNNYSIKLASTDNVSVSYYQVDWDGDGVSNQDITSNVFVPWNGYHSHNNRFRAVDQAGNVSGWSAAHHIHMDTENPTTPTVTFNSGENSHSWKNNYNMTFKSTDNAGVAKFQVDHNQDGTVDREFTASSNAYTFIPESGYSTCTDRYRAVDAAGNVSAWTGVHHIHQDTTLPTVTVSVSGKTATFTIKDNISAIGYGVNQSSSSQPSYTAISGTTSTSKSWTASAAGTYYVWVKDQAGNVNKASFSIASSAFCSYSAGQTWNFAYTGGVQSFTTPCSGTYKLEVWGAQGGNAMSNLGGKGGYSYGNKTVTSGTALYIVVGGAGLTSTSIDVKNGGYNGGGKSQADGSLANYYCGSGGGATHIATATGVLSSLSSNKGAVLIVAGGGGGANYDDGREDYGGPGGAGGGVNGISASRKGDGNTFTATGGTQSSAGTGGSFGQGGNYSYSIHSGGGGGYYGGGTNVHDNAPAAGGSGYIGGVTGGQTIAGNASMPTHAGTSTMIGNTGDGYARITLVSTN